MLDNTFLTIDPYSISEEENSVTNEEDPFKFHMKAVLSNQKYTHSRTLVSFLDLIGNIGGFSDAIWLIISTFMSSYSALMFMQSITKKIPFTTSGIERTDNAKSNKDRKRVLQYFE